VMPCVSMNFAMSLGNLAIDCLVAARGAVLDP
jgi:hypothetical protein